MLQCQFSMGKIRGQQGARREDNPWWGAEGYVHRRYMGAWESGRQQGAAEYVQVAMEL